jgi:co-chaperonin GroES (HSP10)
MKKINLTKQQNNNLFDITKFSCLRDLILVKAIRQANSGELIDPEQYEDKPEFGEIIKLGEGVSDNRLKVGTTIRFGKYSTECIRTNGQDYFLVHEEDISAFLP